MTRTHSLGFFLVAAAAATARAGIDVEVGNGDKVTGTLNPASEVETFRFRVPKEAVITVKAKAAKTGPSSLHVRLLDPGDVPVDARDGKSVTLGGAPLGTAGASGVFVVEIGVTGGAAVATGDYSLSISWKSRPSFPIDEVLGPGGESHLDFAADAQATATFKIKAARGTPVAVPAFIDLTDPNAHAVPVASGDKKTLGLTGGYTVRFHDTGAAGGRVTGSVKLKAAKHVKAKIALTSAAIGSGDTAVAALVGGAAPTNVAWPGGLAADDPGFALTGSSVSIPASCLPAGTAVVIATAPPIAAPNATNAAGPTVDFGPEGLRFDKLNGSLLATVTIPFDAAFAGDTSSLRIYTRDAKGKVTLVDPTKAPNAGGYVFGADTVTFKTSHFSSFRTVSKTTVGPGGNFTTIATITDPRDVCDGFDTGPMTAGTVKFFVAEGDALTVSALRVTLPSGNYVRETWVGGGAQTTTPAARKQFQFPAPVVSVSQDVSGYLFIATATQIWRVDPNSGVIDRIAGDLAGDTVGFGAGDGGSALQATFRSIRRIVTVQNVGLYVADLGAHRVRLIDPLNNITAFAGDGSTGVGPENGVLATTPFVGPSGMMAAKNVGIYVADGARIRWISRTGPLGPINQTVAGSPTGATGSGGDGGAPLSATFQSIAAITKYFPLSAGNDDVFVVADELDHTIRKINLTAGTVTLIAGAHGSGGFNGENGSTPGLLNGPSGLVSNSGRVTVSDRGNQRVREIRVE